MKVTFFLIVVFLIAAPGGVPEVARVRHTMSPPWLPETGGGGGQGGAWGSGPGGGLQPEPRFRPYFRIDFCSDFLMAFDFIFNHFLMVVSWMFATLFRNFF